jgi:hypothetical protein
MREGLLKLPAFALEPGFELGSLDVEAVQKVAAIERHGRGEVFGRLARGQAAKLQDINLNQVGRESHRGAVGLDERDADGLQGLSQVGEGLAEVVLGTMLFAVAPEEAGQLPARLRLSLVERQIGQEALRLLGGNIRCGVQRPLQLEPAQEPNLHRRS